MELWQILLLVGVAVLMAVVGFALGVIYRKKVGEKLIKSAETEAERIVEDAKKQGETKKKEALLEVYTGVATADGPCALSVEETPALEIPKFRAKFCPQLYDSLSMA